MNKDEQQIFEIFIKRAHQVNDSSVYKSILNKASLQINVSYDHKTGGNITTSGFDRESLVYLVTLLRPFISENEPIYIPKVHNLIWKIIEPKSDDFKNSLISARKMLDLILENREIKLIVDHKDYTPEKIIDLRFNADIFHVDQSKQNELTKITNSPAAPFIEFEFQFAIIDLARLVIYYGNMILFEVLKIG